MQRKPVRAAEQAGKKVLTPPPTEERATFVTLLTRLLAAEVH